MREMETLRDDHHWGRIIMKTGMIISLLAGIGIVIIAESTTPAMAWWQFATLGGQGERKISPRFETEAKCNAVLKSTEASLRKAYPNRYPLVGSCEEFH